MFSSDAGNDGVINDSSNKTVIEMLCIFVHRFDSVTLITIKWRIFENSTTDGIGGEKYYLYAERDESTSGSELYNWKNNDNHTIWS